MAKVIILELSNKAVDLILDTMEGYAAVLGDELDIENNEIYEDIIDSIKHQVWRQEYAEMQPDHD